MEQSAAAPSLQAAAAEVKKKPTTLLDAYEVECIRRELQQLVLKHNDQSAARADTAPGSHAHAHAHGHRHSNVGGHHLHHHRVSISAKESSAKRLSPPPPPGPKKDRRRGARLLGRHAVAICGGTVPLAGGTPAGGRGRLRALAMCSGTTTAPVAGAPVVGGRGKERAVALCSGTTTAPVGVDGRRRRPRGGYREVEKV